MDEGKAHLEFEYSQISQIVETNNFIVLKIGNNSAILVLKQGFTKGNVYNIDLEKAIYLKEQINAKKYNRKNICANDFFD